METVSPDVCMLPGQHLRLEVDVDRQGELVVLGYPSMVIGLEPDVLHVDIPKHEGYVLELPLYTPVRGVIATDEALYSFDSEVTGYERHLPVAMCLAVPDEIMRFQRRATVRVPIDATLYLPDWPTIKLRARDLGAGGISFYANKSLNGQLVVRLDIGGPDRPEWVALWARVRRSWIESGEWVIACSFVDLDRRDEDRIVAYLFRRQRELRRAY